MLDRSRDLIALRARLHLLTAALCLLLLTTAPASADFMPGGLTVELEEVAAGLTAPLGVTHAGDGTGRLFIWEQTGQIKIVAGGVLLPTPFLDLSDKLVDLNAFYDERGLLGLTFHPDYASNGRFFVRYSAPRDGDPGEPCNDPDGFIVGCHQEVLAEYQVSADPNLADPSSEIILHEADQPQFNHDGGAVAFGPDGMLYWSLGDGGGANDGLADMPPSHGPSGHAQNTETVLGSILRIDVDGPHDPGLPYAIPPDNPFAAGPGADEIFAYGFRNIYQFSFDDGPGGDGSLFAGDVGQDTFEEIDIVSPGGNYGWVIREGFHCFDPFNPGTPPVNCPDTGPHGEPLLDPIAEYTHLDGGITVIGGFVYRGSLAPAVVGTYLCGDFSSDFIVPDGTLLYLDETDPDVYQVRRLVIGLNDRDYGRFLKGAGEDEAGELYVCGTTDLGPSGTSGVVERLMFGGVVPALVPHLTADLRGEGVHLAWDIPYVDDVDAVHITRATSGGGAVEVAFLHGADANPRGTWTDRTAEPGRQHRYRLRAETEGREIYSNEVEIFRSAALPVRSRLLTAAPNPFNPALEIRFVNGAPGEASVKIYNPAGRLVRTFRFPNLPASEQTVVWAGRSDAGQPVASGVYLVALETAGGNDRVRVTLLK